MGNSSKKPQDYEVVSTYDQSQWSVKQQLTYCQLWHNKLQGYDAEAYQLDSNLKTEELDRYTFRKQNNKDIVGVYHVIPEEDQFLCSKGDKMQVLTERIPITLDKVSRLSQSEALCILTSSYSGYNTIGSHYGPVMPYENSIGFTEIGKPKVWVNSNFAVNHPFNEEKITDSDELERKNRQYVREIFNMVQKRTIQGLPRLRQIFNKKQPTYFEALNILQHYSQTVGIRVPNTIRPRHIDPEELALNGEGNMFVQGRRLALPPPKPMSQPVTANRLHETVFVEHSGATSNLPTSPFQISGNFQNQPKTEAKEFRHVNVSPQPVLMSSSSHNRPTFYSPPPTSQFLPNRNMRVVQAQPFQNPARNQGNVQFGKPLNPHAESTPKLHIQTQVEKVEVQRNSDSSRQRQVKLQSIGQSLGRIQQNQRVNQEEEVITTQNHVHKGRTQERVDPDQKLSESRHEVHEEEHRQEVDQVRQVRQQQTHKNEMKSSDVQQVENKQILQKHIETSKQVIQSPRLHHVRPMMAPSQQPQQQRPQMPIQHQFVNPNIINQQQRPPMMGQPQVPQQIAMRDQFGRIVYVNRGPVPQQPPNQQFNQFPQNQRQVHPSQIIQNQMIHQQQVVQQPPSPQMVSKQESIQEARKSESPAQDAERANDSVNQVIEARDVQSVEELPAASKIRPPQVEVQERREVTVEEDGRDYFYADMQPRNPRKGSASQEKLGVREIRHQEPQPVQEEQNNQYEEYIQIQRQRQERIERDNKRSSQRQEEDKKYSHREQNIEIQPEVRKTRQVKQVKQVASIIQPSQTSQIKEFSGLHAEQRYERPVQKISQQIIEQAKPISSEELIQQADQYNRVEIVSTNEAPAVRLRDSDRNERRSDKNLTQSQRRRKDDQFEMELDQAIGQEANKNRDQYQVQNRFENYERRNDTQQEREPRFGSRKDDLDESMKQYRSIDESRHRNNDDQLNRSYDRVRSPERNSTRRRQEEERERKRVDRERSPKSHTSGRSRSSQLEIARLDREREKLENERKLIESQNRKREEYWEEGGQEPRNQRQSRHSAEERSQPKEDFDWNKYQQERQQRSQKQESGEQKRQPQRDNSNSDNIPEGQPMLQNITSVTTNYEYTKVQSPEERRIEYSNVREHEPYPGRNERKRVSRVTDPIIPQNYEIDDIEEYIRKKYNINGSSAAQEVPASSGADYKYSNRYGSKYGTLDFDKEEERVVSRAMQESDRSGKGDEDLGRHNIMTFMPKDREKNLLEVMKLESEVPSKSSEAFNVADMEKNLVKFQESRSKKPDQQGSSYHHTTTIETRIQSNGDGERVTRKKYQSSYNQDEPYTKYDYKYEDNAEPGSYKARKYSKGSTDYLEKYKGSGNIDDKYDKYIGKRDKLKQSSTYKNENQYELERPARKSRFDKYVKNSRTFEENPVDPYTRNQRTEEIGGSKTFGKKEGGIDKLSYEELRNMLWN